MIFLLTSSVATVAICCLELKAVWISYKSSFAQTNINIYHFIIRTTKSTFIKNLFMDASYSYKSSFAQTNITNLNSSLYVNKIHTNMSSHTSLKACQDWISHKSAFIYVKQNQHNPRNSHEILWSPHCEKFPTLLLRPFEKKCSLLVRIHSGNNEALWGLLKHTQERDFNGWSCRLIQVSGNWWQNFKIGRCQLSVSSKITIFTMT